MTVADKYQACMILSGGGFRYGYYLGMHAAVAEKYQPPDLLLGTCGGAIAAAIIQGLPNNRQRKEWVCSEHMYDFWCGFKANQNAKFTHALWRALKRKFNTQPAPIIPDLFNDYLFEIEQYVPLPELTQAEPEIAVAIVAGKLLYDGEDVGKPRANRKLFQEVIFCSDRSKNLLLGIHSSIAADNNAITSEVLLNTITPINEAARASVSDMFYFRCHEYQSERYIGGAINLMPIEAAKQLAHKVIAEIKCPYDTNFAVPALRAAFGIDGNERLNNVLSQFADLWIDTSDMQAALKSARIQKKLNWSKNQIELFAPPSYPEYVRMIEAQWQYGYDRAALAIAASELAPL
jgi:predicted acylesterase/phospholipase RssA